MTRRRPRVIRGPAQPQALRRRPDRTVDGRSQLGGDRLDLDLVPDPVREAPRSSLTVHASPVEPPVNGSLDAPRSGWNRPAATSVDAATTIVWSRVNEARGRLQPEDRDHERQGRAPRSRSPRRSSG